MGRQFGDHQRTIAYSYELATATRQKAFESRLAMLTGQDMAAKAFAAVVETKHLLAKKVPCIEEIEPQ